MSITKSSVSWVNPKIEIRDAGDIGIGSFVTEDVAKGEILIVQGGRIVSESTLDEPAYEAYAYHCFQVERDAYICPVELERGCADGVFNVNHSCEPTGGFRGQITLVSMRDLKAGEQVTFDYAMTDVGSEDEGWKDMDCKCESQSCRKKVGGSDWKIPELQDRYKGYFSPYVQELIDRNQP